MISIPGFGKAGPITIEDQYNTGSTIRDITSAVSMGFNSGNATGTQLQAGAPQEVIFHCAGKKRRVVGLLNEGIRIKGQAKWEEMFGGGMTSIAGGALDTVSKVMQWSKAVGFQQPWMNRKVWVSSTPFTFTLPVTFVAEDDPRTDVYMPAITLLSFCYPRYNQDGGTGKDVIDKTFNTNVGGIVGATTDAFASYVIPGPGIRYGTASEGADDVGDAVSIVAGKAFIFGACYVTDVDLEFSQAMSGDGWPLACRATVTATMMDSNYCASDGSFLIQGFTDSFEKLSTAVNTISSEGRKLGEKFLKVLTENIGFYLA